ncbi:TauD/TfdA family dioxygenase [Lysobacter enzymogenes]|uniref:TauD/TfdA family dioxygenase n=1 Tax=Lysobacter enzymogenes TaxID=69 RepID=UPI001A96D669|nr:TauD/TfdA family dioxygenase [Lysobacter enzymogenes]QQP96614.1 TauD/TfdA family dioxygenase [Lysobacter enzymogenes]
MADGFERVRVALARNGYVYLRDQPSKQISQLMLELATRLGGSIRTGRGGAVIELLEEREAVDAPLCSLSRMTGAGAQPWHVDGSHSTLPPRYLIFGCQSITGAGVAPTQLLRIKDAGLPHPASNREPFVVRNGRASFYSTISSLDRPWIRFDPGCMRAQTDEGRLIVEKLLSAQISPFVSLEWQVGDILVVDNWAVFHRRGKASGLGRRTLLRISLAS